MSEVMKQGEIVAVPIEIGLSQKIANLLPVVVPIALAAAIEVARLKLGPTGFLNEGALTMLALICYVTAAVLLVTNLFVKEGILYRLGLITVSTGYCFNLSGWMMRWIEAGDKEGWKEGINGVWRYFPLDNLYALTLGFCAGAALATLVIIRKPQYRFLGAMSMPILAVIMTLGTFLGNDIITLQPVLDSYWRPIHVSIATIGYGVCLVSFGLAFAYLLKDGVRSEAIAIGALLFGVLVYTTIGRSGGVFQVPANQEYGAALFMRDFPLPVRAMLPGMGWLMLLTLLVIVVSLALFVIDRLAGYEKACGLGWRLFWGAVVLQAIVLVALLVQVRSINGQVKSPDRMSQLISVREKADFEVYYDKEIRPRMPAEQQSLRGEDWLRFQSADLSVRSTSNPVEFGALVGVFVALLCVGLFAWRREDVVGAMPALQTIDTLLYRTVGVAFPLLTMLLITGAVWANESWGRYWGWDPKEVGALVAWLAYAGFLHTRVAHGWRGRRSAYFALLGFALVIFTWLGVSYLLKGLHSYA